VSSDGWHPVSVEFELLRRRGTVHAKPPTYPHSPAQYGSLDLSETLGELCATPVAVEPLHVGN
jgi:hypothetical protein